MMQHELVLFSLIFTRKKHTRCPHPPHASRKDGRALTGAVTRGEKLGRQRKKGEGKRAHLKPNDENPQTLSLSSLFHDTYELVVIESADPNDASHTVWCHPGTPSVRS